MKRMRREIKRRLLSGLLTLAMVMPAAGMSLKANAAPQVEPEPQAQAGATEEEIQSLKDEYMQGIYEMPIATNDIKGWPQGPGTYGEAAIVMEAGTGAILYGKNIDDQHYPASITKLLTVLVALEHAKLSDPVTFSHDCVAFLQPGDSSVGLKEGNQITMEEALYATLLASANEAAYAVGESTGINCGQDYNWFLGQMNQKCKELGGKNSNFVNTNGLHDPNHYTSARDMALIGKELFKYPEFFQIVQTLNYTIPATETTEEHVFQQKHKMLIPGNSNYYEYAIGGKTGYTSDALSTLVTMADNGEMQLVCVVLRTHGTNIYPDTTNLFEYAFHNFNKIPVQEYENSGDIEKILDEEGDGYVVLPPGVEFQDLKMEIIPDSGIESKATLQYTYEGNPVGTARAQLSESYIKAHSAKVEKAKSEEAENVKDKKESSLTKPVIGAIILLVVLIVLWIMLVIRSRQRRKRRRRRTTRRRRNKRP